MAPNFLTVKTLHQQKGCDRQRPTGGEGSGSAELADDAAAEPTRARDLTFDNYFLGVELWTLALAKAGIDAVDNPPTVPEHADSDSTDYVCVPWEVVKKWLDRAHNAAKKVPSESRYQWLENRVDADVRIWVEEYRLHREKTLGKIVAQVFEQTATSWYYDDLDQAPKAIRGGQAAPRRQPSRSRRRRNRGRDSRSQPQRRRRRSKRTRTSPRRTRTSPRQPSETSPPPRRASRLRSGEALCTVWNAKPGGCSEPCPRKKRHLCSVIQRGSGRVCGMYNHRACNHKQPPTTTVQHAVDAAPD